MNETIEDRRKKIVAIEMHVLTDARRAHGDVEVRVSKRGGFDVKATMTPLELYHRKRMLGHPEDAYPRLHAGKRLYRDWYVSGQAPMLTIDFDRIRSADKRQFLPATEKQREALDSYRAAIAAVHGVIGKLLVINVCCHDQFLKEIQTRYYKRGQDAMPRFLEALDDLAKHYIN